MKQVIRRIKFSAAAYAGQRYELALLYFFRENLHRARDSAKNSPGAATPHTQAQGDNSPIKNKPGKFVITKTGRIYVPIRRNHFS